MSDLYKKGYADRISTNKQIIYEDGKIYKPDGELCINCKLKWNWCGGMKFFNMPVVYEQNNIITVTCRNYRKR